MASKSICVRTDEQVKNDAEALFESMGMTLSTAVNIFLRQAIRANGMPFELKGDVPNATTISAMQEADRNVANAKGYGSIDSLRATLGV